MEPSIRYCTTEDGVRIAYCVEGKGPPLVLTPFLVESFVLDHVSPGHERFVRKLEEHFQLVRYDSRCVGSSQRELPEVTGEAFVRDLEAVVKATSLERVSVLGRGHGGPAALIWAALHPRNIERLILYGTGARLQDNVPLDAIQGLAQLALANWEIGARTMADFSGRQEFGERALENAKWYHESTSGAEVARLAEGVVSINATPELSKIRCPTLVIHPMDDAMWRLEHAQRLAAAIPSAVFMPVQGSFHHIAFGDPEPVLRAIVEFMGVAVGPAGLSRREVEVLRLLAEGRSNREIGAELVLSVRTVERHVTNIYRKIDAHNRAQATAFALEHGLTRRSLTRTT